MKLKLVILAALLPLAACGSPYVKPSEPTAQHKVTHAAHWEQLAERQVNELLPKVLNRPEFHLAGSGTGVGDGAPQGMNTFYIQPIAHDMPFSEVYVDYLTKELIDRGYLVASNPDQAIVVNTDVKTFLYGGEKRALVKEPGFWGAIATLGFAASELSTFGAGEGMAIAAGSGAILQVLKELDDRTNAEVVLKTTVRSKSHVVHMDMEPFYVRPSELPFYWTAFPDTPAVNTTPERDKPMAAVSIMKTR